MAQYTALAFEINLYPEGADGLVFEVGSLFEALCTLHDQRDARGLRYRLVTVLVLTLLAKLAGENHLRGIGQWVSLRALLLASFLALTKVQAPHASTYSRILGRAVLNNLVLGLLLRRGVKNVPDARRDCDADPQQAFALITGLA